jgi:hypothetical protein
VATISFVGTLTGRSLRAAERLNVNLAGLKARRRAKLTDWRGLLRRNVQDARGVLRTLLIGPLRFTPVNDGRRRSYAFEGPIALDRLLSGVVSLPTKVASPTETDTLWTREIPGMLKPLRGYLINPARE